MKLLQVNSSPDIGSTGRIVNDLGNFVTKCGGESFIAYGRYGKKRGANTIKIGSKISQLHHLIQTRLFDTHGLHSRRATENLLDEIREINPDIIHLHNLHGYYLNIETLFIFLKKYGRPVIWTLHDCWPFTGHCCYYERVKCDKWKTICGSCELSFLYPETKVFDNSEKNFLIKRNAFLGVPNLTIVTVSEWLATQVQQSFLKDYPLQTIYNGIDADIFKPKNQIESKEILGLSDFKIILGVANEWSDGKGLNMFFEISKHLDSNSRVVLIGLNKKQMKTLPKGIIGFNRTKDLNELVNFYNAADVFVSPSVAETFGLVVAEALSCGTPCVVNHSSALPELVDESVGYVVSNDYREYITAIKLILSVPKLNFLIATTARAEQFELSNHLKSYYNLYKKILNS
jgi:putative colanic acid biosynthesis glycosyltransferase